MNLNSVPSDLLAAVGSWCWGWSRIPFPLSREGFIGRWQRLLLSLLVAIVLPILATEILEDLYNIPESMEWIIHSMALAVTISPVFFFLWYRPLSREITERLRAEAEIRRLSRQVMDASEKERCRLARDLHDDIGQRLVALQLQIDIHRQQYSAQHPELAEQCRHLGAQVSELADDLRHVIVGLRPPLIDDLGLQPALEAHLADLRKICPELEVQLLASGLGRRLSAEIEMVLFRVCQEALNNVVKHAQARQVQVRVTGSYPSVILIVEDDGVGFLTAGSAANDLMANHCGLSGIRERVAAVGGTARIQSTPGKGTRVRIELPLSAGG